MKDRLESLLKGRSMRQASADWGIAFTTLRNWLSTDTSPSFDAIAKIAKHEKVDLNWLAYGEKNQNKPNKEQAEPKRAQCDVDFRGIVKYNIAASAGGGSFIDTEHDADIIHVSKIWLRQKRLLSKNLCIIEAKGTSMEPFIHDGDDLFVDLTHQFQEKPFDGVFAINLDGLLKVKRLEFSMPMNGYRIISDNKEFKEEFVKKEEIEDRLTVVGEVVMVLGQPAASSQQPQE